MSLSSTLSNALSGLTVASRGAQVTSNNVANAATAGYGRRVIEPTVATLNGAGAGVQVAGVQRESDPLLIAERRLAQAESGQAETRSSALDALEAAFGTPEDGNSLTVRLSNFESALVDAASRPDDSTRQATVLRAAQDLTSAFKTASDQIQDLREQADAGISSMVERINASLSQIDELNDDIVSAQAGRRDASGLLDQRQALIDDLAEIVPLRECARENGAVALYTSSGAALLDGRPAVLEFTAANVIVPAMTLSSGALSIPTLDGDPVLATGTNAPLAGGQLEALFEQRDQLAPAAQTSLDALAQTLVERFADAGLDPTLAAGAAGLFTDAGGAITAAPAAGLAGRIAVNTAVDPDSGGALWRLRDGIGAATPGAVGDATLLSAMAERLSATQVVSSGPYAGRTLSIHDLAAESSSALSGQAAYAEGVATQAAARTVALTDRELSAGVDTDVELQNLLKFEKLYTANARVLQTVEEMFDTILGI